MIQDRMRYLLSKDHQHHKWRLQKAMDTRSRTIGMCKTSSRRSIRLHPRSKWKMPRRCWKFQSQMSRYLDTSTTTQMGLNHGPVWKTQSYSWTNLYGHLLAGLLWERQFEKILWAWLGECSNWECLFVHREKGLFLSVCGRDKTGWKETKY